MTSTPALCSRCCISSSGDPRPLRCAAQRDHVGVVVRVVGVAGARCAARPRSARVTKFVVVHFERASAVSTTFQTTTAPISIGLPPCRSPSDARSRSCGPAAEMASWCRTGSPSAGRALWPFPRRPEQLQHARLVGSDDERDRRQEQFEDPQQDRADHQPPIGRGNRSIRALRTKTVTVTAPAMSSTRRPGSQERRS
jgi:hypothetical protein